MSDLDKCEICSGELVGKIDGLCQGLFCTTCEEWKVVTTYIPEIFQDEVVYEIFLDKLSSENLNLIKAVSKVTNLNYLQTKKFLEKENNMVFSGKAPEVKEVALYFEEEKIAFHVEPNFTY